MKPFLNLSIVSFLLIFTTAINGQANALTSEDSNILTHAKSTIVTNSSEANYFNILDFGSYFVPGTNNLQLVPQKEIVYTKAELINKETNQLHKSIILDSTTKMIDLSGTPASTYLLILTNEAGNISVEELTIL